MRYTIIILLFFSILPLKSQNYRDALLYSMKTHPYTARSAAMGNAFGALGGDMSTLSMNPGGLGVYRSSEFTTSLTHIFNSTDAGIDNLSDNAIQNDFGIIPNIGVVFNTKGQKSKISNYNFGLNYTKTDLTHRNIFFKTTNYDNSMLDDYAYWANENPDFFDPFDENLAYQTYLISFNPSNGTFNPPLDSGEGVYQESSIVEKGHTGEFDISWGMNYDDKLYLGITLGIENLFYSEQVTYKENSLAGENNNYGYSSFELLKNRVTSGSGINVKFGTIYRPTTSIRVGAAIHTPTSYYLNDYWQNTISTLWTQKPDTNLTSNTIYAISPEGESNYRFNTPLRAILSIAYVWDKKVILSIDYEYINYAKAKYIDIDYTSLNQINNINREISTHLKNAYHLRTGAEYRIIQPIFLRVGYSIHSSPYSSENLNYEYRVTKFSGGLGYRYNLFFMDVAYINTQINNEVYKWYLESPAVDIKNNNNEIKLSFGWKF